MDYTLASAILLLALGWILLLLEVVILPGLIAGIVGFVLQICGAVLIWNNYDQPAGWLVVSGMTIINGITLWWSFRDSSWKGMTLHETVDGKVGGTANLGIAVGDTGISISRLAPAGTAKIQEQLLEVHSLEGFINEQENLIVVKITPDKIFVKTH
jgi:membrane-bound ClpP family serine protease